MIRLFAFQVVILAKLRDDRVRHHLAPMHLSGLAPVDRGVSTRLRIAVDCHLEIAGAYSLFHDFFKLNRGLGLFIRGDPPEHYSSAVPTGATYLGEKLLQRGCASVCARSTACPCPLLTSPATSDRLRLSKRGLQVGDRSYLKPLLHHRIKRRPYFIQNRRPLPLLSLVLNCPPYRLAR